MEGKVPRNVNLVVDKYTILIRALIPDKDTSLTIGFPLRSQLFQGMLVSDRSEIS